MTEEITCDRFHDGHQLRGPTRLVIEDGRVSTIEPLSGQGRYRLVSPGLVDLQMNGWSDIDVADADVPDLERLGATLAELGTTSWLATVTTAPLDRLSERVVRLDRALQTGRVPGLCGIHLEGPFLGRSPGAHPTAHIVPVDQDWLAQLPPTVRLVTLAAEATGALEAIPLLRARGIGVSLGHSAPSQGEFRAALDAGATIVTHLFNGMSGAHHRRGGLALWSLVNPQVTVGVIADMVHLAPEAVLLAFLSEKGARPYLVSDTVAWDTDRARRQGIRVIDGAPRLPDGTLAGASTPLSEAVRLAVGAGVAVADALVAASSRPAQILGLNAGRLSVGDPADLVAFDDDLRVAAVRSRLPSARA